MMQAVAPIPHHVTNNYHTSGTPIENQESRIKIKALTKINGRRERKALLPKSADWSEPTHNHPPETSISFIGFENNRMLSSFLIGC